MSHFSYIKIKWIKLFRYYSRLLHQNLLIGLQLEL